jgi:hypothetical protein
MSWTILAAALAGLGASAPAPALEGEAFVVEAPDAAPSRKIVLAVAAAAAAMAVAEDSGETLEIYPLQFAPRRLGGVGPQFQFGGVGLSFAAYRSKVPSDPLGLVNFRGESRAMGKFMPGYPQPAKVVVGLKVTF